MSIKHKRKDGYWLYYHLAHTVERDTVIENIVYLVKENPPLCSNVSSNSRRGRKPVHSWEKLVCICILMVIFGLSYRDMQNAVPSLNLPWNNDEPYPDHTWIARTFKKIPLKYLEDILTKSTYLCLKESEWKKEGLHLHNERLELTNQLKAIKNITDRRFKVNIIQIRNFS